MTLDKANQLVTSRELKQLVKIVVDARDANEPGTTIVDRLTSVGIAAKDVPNVIDCIEKGFKHGVLSVVTGGMSSADITFGENPLFDMAFRMGRSEMRWTSPGWVLARMVVPIVVALVAIVAIVYAIAK